MSGSVFSETLQEITTTKLNELSKRRIVFEEAKSSLLSFIQSQPDLIDPIEKLALLSNGVKNCFAIRTDKEGKVIKDQTKHRRLEVKLKNLDRFLAQARHDPSVSTKALEEWEKELLGHLDTQSLRFQYASLYGELVTEWLSESNGKKSGGGNEATPGDGADIGEAFEDVGSAAKLKSKSKWESTVFEPAKVDVDILRGYLNSLFGCDDDSAEGVPDNSKLRALKTLRDSVEAFEARLARPDQFNQHNLKWAMQGLLSSDLLTNDKREVLKDFMGNPIILSEIADVLNMRFSALESWTWGFGGVPVEQRRKINGVFSIHMHEDLLQAIFLQYIGIKWSVFFKRVFVKVRNNKNAWSTLDKDIPGLDRKRLEYYLGPLKQNRCLQKERQITYNQDYFVAKLLRQEDQSFALADGEVEVELYSEGAVPRKRMRQEPPNPAQSSVRFLNRKANKSDTIQEFVLDAEDSDEGCGFMMVEDEDEKDVVVKTPIQLKQQLLHLLSTEIAINTRLHNGLSAFHAVFEDWDTLLSHETICTVLEFLGVSSTWLGFFTKYLQATLRFVEEGDTSQLKVRRRGVPSSHILSDVFSEAVLFCLDIAVNQAACGQPLWRVEDDLWFWSYNHQTTAKAWTAVEHFASVTATSINWKKSGSARISCDNDIDLQTDSSLPQGEIRWGFLVLSPSTGRFEIDQMTVDSHIAELGQQLNDKKSSIFAFIQTWNTYAATFFSSNFGKSANCFGRQHVDDMLATHKRIQQQIFSEDSGAGLGSASSIVDYLKKTIDQRFGVTNIPDGYFYSPVEIGGLDLQSPFISLLQIRDSVLESHDSLFETMYEAELGAYELLKSRFHRSTQTGSIKTFRRGVADPNWEPESQQDREEFFSFDEFVQHREEICIFPHISQPKDISWVYSQLMAKPTEQSVDPDIFSGMWASLGQLGTSNRKIIREWNKMDSYWRWVMVMYGPEIVERFGDLSIVDAGLLPMGMIGLFREKRVTWKG
ncbi:hypothetical protein VM1G_05736 [Cytospora mali]|uniref:Reverse transcriptase domain-containing protein n=1 Tax=Cytospora mali TaxID=578113 RepID=A0A194W2N3_CYTMA|nr:hypothetical protein VM1G_05736 [Valsa mali]